MAAVRVSIAGARVRAERTARAGAWIGVLAISLAGCSTQPLPRDATLQAESLHGIWVVFFWSGIAVAAVVYGLIAWCVIRYRRRPEDVDFPVQFRRNNKMEMFYTAVPIAMVAGLFAITYPAERHVETIAAHQAVVVRVTAFRWSWKFDYPELGAAVAGTTNAPPVFELPVNETTRFEVSSVDVDHSFWIPEFLFKRDAVPGLQNVFDWTPTRIGTFRGECAEFCGLDHTLMSFSLKVVSRSDFDRWIGAHSSAAPPREAAR